jgi:hypothetical protein
MFQPGRVIFRENSYLYIKLLRYSYIEHVQLTSHSENTNSTEQGPS